MHCALVREFIPHATADAVVLELDSQPVKDGPMDNSIKDEKLKQEITVRASASSASGVACLDERSTIGWPPSRRSWP